MASASPIQTNFTAGEWSPRLAGRVDLDKYNSSANVLENMVVQPHGPAAFRGGSQFVATTKFPTKKSRLVPFEFSTTQAFVLEFGDQYIRVYAEQVLVTVGAFALEFANEFNKFSPFEVPTTYLEADLFELQFSQSADVLYIAHTDYEPMVLSRVSAGVWEFVPFVSKNGPFMALNLDDTLTITPSATTGLGITLTASAALFVLEDVGALWRIGAGNGYVKITAFTSNTLVTADVIEDLPAATATSDWSEGSWSAANGFPGAVAFFEQRLVWGGTFEEPQTIWGSVSGDYNNYLIGTNDGDAIIYTIASQQVNTIQWLSSGDVLAIGTAGGVHVASGTTRDSALTPTNVRFVQKTKYGCKQVEPITIANVAIYVQRGGEKVRQLEYEFESDSYNTPDLTILSEHITRGGLVQMAYQQDPDSIIWAVRADGQLIGMTFERDQQVFAWHRHILGGQSDAAGADAQVESVTVIPSNSDPAYNEVWLSVKRWVNGAEIRHLEVLTAGLKPDADISTAFFVDSGLSYSGVPVTVLTGLDHLIGETVRILADGAPHPDRVVSGSGSVTLERSASTVHIGLGYNGDIGTQNLEAGSDTGTGQGKIKRISQVTLRLYQSVGVLLGSSPTSLDRIPFRSSADAMDQPLPPFTGDKKLAFNAGYGTQGRVYIRQDQPLPLTVLAIMPEVSTNG